jgi:hypothetical protein
LPQCAAPWLLQSLRRPLPPNKATLSSQVYMQLHASKVGLPGSQFFCELPKRLPLPRAPLPPPLTRFTFVCAPLSETCVWLFPIVFISPPR